MNLTSRLYTAGWTPGQDPALVERLRAPDHAPELTPAGGIDILDEFAG